MEEFERTRDEIDLQRVFALLWRKRGLNAAVIFVFLAIGLLYALVIATPLYRSSITLYPIDGEQAANSQLRTMASQFGIGGLDGTTSSYNIPDVATSRRIAKNILDHRWVTEDLPDDPTDLTSFWGLGSDEDRAAREAAIRRIMKRISVRTDDETGLVTISVLAEEPQLAADIVNFLGEAVTTYIRDEQKAQAQDNIEFIAERSAAVHQELAVAEDALRSFLTKNRNYEDSPTLTLEMDRLRQQVAIKREVYVTLEKQRELTMIEGIKDAAVVNMLDIGEKDARRAEPNRRVIVLSALFAALIVGLVLSLLAGDLNGVDGREERERRSGK